jgi:hypothetical protein
MVVTSDELEELPWKDVASSSNIERVAFVAEDVLSEVGKLYVQFVGGRAYTYAGVPMKLWGALEALVDSGEGSVGSFVAYYVRGEFETAGIQVED